MSQNRYRDIVEAAAARQTGDVSPDLIGYVTDGGTYVVASSPTWNDDNQPHDLFAVLPAPVEGSRVLVLRPTVHPDLLAAVRARLDQPTS